MTTSLAGTGTGASNTEVAKAKQAKAETSQAKTAVAVGLPTTVGPGRAFLGRHVGPVGPSTAPGLGAVAAHVADAGRLEAGLTAARAALEDGLAGDGPLATFSFADAEVAATSISGTRRALDEQLLVQRPT